MAVQTLNCWWVANLEKVECCRNTSILSPKSGEVWSKFLVREATGNFVIAWVTACKVQSRKTTLLF